MRDSILEKSACDMDKFCKEGCLESFGHLYDKYAPALLGVVSRVAGHGKTAEEILQKSFLEMYIGRSNYDGTKESPFLWMNKIVLKSAILFMRSQPAPEVIENHAIINLVYDSKIESA